MILIAPGRYLSSHLALDLCSYLTLASLGTQSMKSVSIKTKRKSHSYIQYVYTGMHIHVNTHTHYRPQGYGFCESQSIYVCSCGKIHWLESRVSLSRTRVMHLCVPWQQKQNLHTIAILFSASSCKHQVYLYERESSSLLPGGSVGFSQ